VPNFSNFRIVFLCSFVSIVILIFDAFLPLGVAGGVAYVFVILLSLFSSQKYLTLKVALATSIFTVAGLFISPLGGELWQVLLNRGLAIFAIWSVALLGEKLKKTVVENEVKEQEFQKIFELSPDIIGKGTLDGEFVEINSALTKILGYKKEEFLAKPFIDFVHEEDVKDTLSDLNEAVSGKRNIMCNNRYRCSDGHYKWLEWNVLAFSENNVFYAVARDVTERIVAEKKVESSNQRLAEVQKIAHLGHWEFAHSTDEISYSDEVYRILNIAFKDKITNKTYLNLIHPDDKEKVYESYKNSRINQQPFHIHHRLLFSDGSLKHISLHGESIYNNEGASVGSFGIIQDITVQAELKERMLNNQKMDALGKLTGGIAHDFNNMLGVVVGYSEILEKLLIEQPKLCEYAKQITLSGRKGAVLTDKLLSFSKQKKSYTSCTVINELIMESQDIIKKSITSKIDLNLNLADELWCTNIDNYEFDNVLLNLCINSKHAMPNGGNLVITTQNQSLSVDEAKALGFESYDFVVLSVKDNGTGISKELQGKIFEPFYSTKGELGTGLGLSQVYGFVKAASGNIKVHSSPEQGCEFVIYLPRCVEVKSKNRSSRTTITTKPTTNTMNKKILIVDDEKPLLQLLKEILTTEGYQVVCAEGGIQAIAILKEQDFDLLLSDIIMPKMNGYQLAEQVQNLFPHVRIIFTSGYQDDLPNFQTDSILALPFIEKPYDTGKLLSTIKQSLFEPFESTDENTESEKNSYKPNNLEAKKDLKEAEITQWSEYMMIDDNGVIDDDHRQLLNILSQCQEFEEADVNFAIKMQDLTQELALYTIDHFAKEELAMKVCAYPYAKNHCEVHRLMAKELNEAVKSKSPQELKKWIITCLSDWLLDHIMVMDKALQPYIKAKADEVQLAMNQLIEQRR